MTAPSAEEFFEDAAASAASAPEGFAEDVEWILATHATTHTTAGVAHAALLESGVSVAVVGSALFAIFKHVVSLGNFLKLGFGGFVAWVFVRVIFDRLFAVSLFKVGIGDVTRDTQKFVIASRHIALVFLL